MISTMVLNRSPGALLDLYEEIARCAACHLSRFRTHTVPGEGHAPCDVMLVGEGSGAEEDRTGRPFVSKAGQLLRRLLVEEAHLEAGAVYITNVVKCRSFVEQGDRRVDAPPPAHCRKACEPFLALQFLLVQPKVVIVVGSTASQQLLGVPITKTAGTLVVFSPGKSYLPALFSWISNDIFLLPIEHPAAALRNGEVFEELRCHVRAIGDFLDRYPTIRRRAQDYSKTNAEEVISHADQRS